MHSKISLFATIFVALAVVSACSSYPEFPDITSKLDPYRVEVRQGNFITQEMVAKLKHGQTKDQVRFALGSPLIEDAFHSQRWDYVYRFQSSAGEVTQRHFTAFFESDKLVRVAGDVIANSAEAEAAEQRNAPKKTKVIVIGEPAAETPAVDKPNDKPNDKPAAKP